MNRRERRAAGKPGPVSGKPGAATAAALYKTGLGHLRAERYLDAQLCCERALAADSAHADSLHLMGLVSLQTAQYDHAVEWLARAIRQDPKPEYLASLGRTLQRQQRYDDALKLFDKAIQLRPDSAELWRDVGDVLAELGRTDHALQSFQNALKHDPRDRDAADKSASLLFGSGRLEEAIAGFTRCAQLRPDHAPTLQMRALAQFGLNRFAEGLADIERAHAFDPGNADICNNAGVFLQKLGRHQDALAWFDRTLERQPDYPAAFTNKASSLTHLGQFTEAFAAYDALLLLHPGHPEGNWAKALLHLLMGNFEAGWAGREVRSRVPDLPIFRFDFPQPRWLGREPIDGKTVLIHVDEGLGDTIQFVRYVPEVAARGARVVLVVADPLYPLLSGLPGVAECLPLSRKPLPAFDLYCPLSSLPLAFGTRLQTIPSTVPYLPAPPASRVQAWEDRLQDRLGAHDRLRVGLVWSGNPKHKNDANRSIALDMLSPILALDADFVSLQKDARPDDKVFLAERTGILDTAADLGDFADTAALVCCLDLVISVDTSVAHLAGALGRPTWVLVTHIPDYRWLLDRDDSPWYPTARLFRQPQEGDFATPIERMRAELAALIETRRAG
jgi:tetratricopeptide (TPR) repeat protein